MSFIAYLVFIENLVLQLVSTCIDSPFCVISMKKLHFTVALFSQILGPQIKKPYKKCLQNYAPLEYRNLLKL